MARNLNAARILIAGVMLALAFGVISQRASAQQFIPFNYPGATNSTVNLISNRGEIVGIYFSTFGVDDRGFTLLNGQYTAIDFPGAVQTNSSGVNDLGEVVGGYVDAGGVTHGFLLSGATYSTIDFPGSNFTQLVSINDTDEIVGEYMKAGSSVTHGFSLVAGVFTTIDFPGSHLSNVPNQVNNLGVIAGWYADQVGANFIEHGYVYDAGVFTAINFPGASSTAVNAITDAGELSGIFGTAAGLGGFTYLNGHFTTVSFPSTINGVFNLAVNDVGQLIPDYTDSDGHFHAAVSAIGPFAYVAAGTNATNNLLVIDAPTGLQVTTISIPGYAGTPASTPDGKHVYVGCGSSGVGVFPTNEVCVVDVATNAVVNIIPVGNGVFGLAITPDGTTAYIANLTDSTVSVINISSQTVIATIPVGKNPEGVAITPDGKLAYVATFSGGVYVINTATNKVVTTIPSVVGGYPVFSPNGDLEYINSTTSPGLVTVISTSTNSVVGTIAVGKYPISTAISPDGSTLYVANLGDNTISIIDTATRTVIATVPSGGTTPGDDFLTPDGSVLWVLNQNNIAEISTITDGVIAPLSYPNTTAGAGIFVKAPPTSQSITHHLSPTAPTTFNYGPHNFTVQYPPGTSFSGVNMTVVAAQATQASIQQRLSGTPFANAACVVYSGAGGNCLDYQASCTNMSGSQITCPSESSPTITVKTSFDTLQPITNPGFLTTPIGTNNWTNIFDSFYLQRIDPTMKGKTSGFSEFVAVDLGATNSQGAGTFQFLAPLESNDQRSFVVGASIPVEFHLTSVANPAVPVTDATAGITVVMISDASGNPTTKLVLEKPAAFTYGGGNYSYSLSTSGYAPGMYNITVYGNAFVAQQVEFTLTAPTGPRISTTLQSLTLNKTTKQYAAVFKISNTGGALAKNLAITASSLDSTATVTSLPASLGNVNPASSVNVTLLFPESAGAPNSSGEITISESYAGGTSGGGFRVTLP